MGHLRKVNVYRALAFNEEMERQMEGRCAVLVILLNIYLHSDCELWCTCTLLKVSKVYIRQSAVSHALIPCQPEPSDFSNWALLHPLAPLRPFCVLLWPRDFLFCSHVIELVRFQTGIKSSGWPHFISFSFLLISPCSFLLCRWKSHVALQRDPLEINESH